MSLIYKVFNYILITTALVLSSAKINAQKYSKADSLKVIRLLDSVGQVPLFSIKRQNFLDSLLAIKPSEASWWQQKAMPLFKQRKYELGLPFLDSAVKYDTKENHYLEYRAFMKCIFLKNYKSAIEDFQLLQKINKGERAVMDHPYEFYLSICFLQLNKFKEAEEFLNQTIINEQKGRGEDFNHYMDWFYKGVICFEMNQNDSALFYFEKCLKRYSQFSDAIYYKVLCSKNGKANSEIVEQLETALKFAQKGYTINEDNAIYEKYPYQISKEQIEAYLYYSRQRINNTTDR